MRVGKEWDSNTGKETPWPELQGWGFGDSQESGLLGSFPHLWKVLIPANPWGEGFATNPPLATGSSESVTLRERGIPSR